MFKNNTKETFQIFEFFSFWNKQRVTYISPLLEGTELKTAWYFCQKKRSQEKKNVSLAFYRYCNQPLPTAAHEIRSGLCISGHHPSGPLDPIHCFPHPHGRDWRKCPFLHCTAASFGIMCHSLILQVTSVLFIGPLSSGQWFTLDGHLEF